MTKSDSLIKKIAENSIIAAIYFVLTVAIPVFQYGDIQFRVAEFLVLLCFWRPDFVFGVTLGCFFANFASPMGMVDVFMGTGATLISSLMVAYLSPRLLAATIYPIVANGFVVGFELSWILGLPFWPSVGTVAAGEAAVIFISYFLWMSLSHNKGFMRAINPQRHLEVHW